KTEDHQTFKNYHLAGFEIDASASTGRSHLIIGSRIDGVFIGRFNADNWLLRDTRVRGIPNEASLTPTNNLSVIFVAPYHAAADEAVASTLTNIRVENVVAFGGNGGFQIAGYHGGAGT